MSTNAIRWVLGISLALLLPLPLYVSGWGWVPAYYGLELIIGMGANLDLWLLLPQLLVALFICALLAEVYIRCSANWPVKLRVSTMGIVVLSSIIMFSTFNIYRLPILSFPSVSFLEIYQ